MSNGRRQPSCGGTSRISREAYVRFCEGLGVKFPGPTRQTECRTSARSAAALGFGGPFRSTSRTTSVHVSLYGSFADTQRLCRLALAHAAFD